MNISNEQMEGWLRECEARGLLHVVAIAESGSFAYALTPKGDSTDPDDWPEIPDDAPLPH